MSLLIPFAAPLSEAGRAALATLALPRLQHLLGLCTEVLRDEGDEWSWSPPHERALARALGWAGPAGRLPWAAQAAAADAVAAAERLGAGDIAWGLVTPAHWHLGTDQVSLLDPTQLMLSEDDSRALFEAVAPLFTGDGWLAAWGAPLRWYVAHESLAELACASPDRVIGRNVDAWLGSDPAARQVRRLQAEAQMLLHMHPVNAARESRGLLPVNSFWLSGCGVAQPVTGTPPVVDERLRLPALRDDWAAWTRAWQTLDEGPLAELLARAQRGEPVALTLAGERSAVTLANAEGGWLQRWRRRLAPPSAIELLRGL